MGYDPNDTLNGYEENGAGNYVIVKTNWNGKDIYCNYYHLKFPFVSEDQNISKGQPIAISGNTGNSTGPHLHFEIREGTQNFNQPRSRRNPELWAGIDGMGAIYGRVPNAPNSARVDISPDPKPRPPYTTFSYALTYNFNDQAIGSDDIYNENYAIGDVKPGTYTITALNGTYKRVVTVHAGEVVNADAPTGVDDKIIADDFSLFQNYPNPFNPSTVISWQLAVGSHVSLKVYNVLGNEVAELVNEMQAPGAHRIEFSTKGASAGNAHDLVSGMYIYVLTAGDFVSTKKMMVLK